MSAETSRFVGERALVTGASGFIGSALARSLRAAGAEVHGVSRQAREGGDVCDRWWRVDLADASAARRLVESVAPTRIFHFASRVTGGRGIEQVPGTLADNLISAVHLLQAATEIGCRRIVFAGSMEEPDPGPDWPIPASPYAAAKFAASSYARMFHALYGTPVVWLRLFMVYGPGQADGQKLIPYVIRSLRQGQAPVLASGRRRVDWIYVDDVVQATLIAAHAPGIEGATIEIGSGRLHTVREVVERLTALVAPTIAPRFGSLPDRPLEQERAARVEQTHGQIGWRASTGLDDGLVRTVAAFRASARPLPATAPLSTTGT